MKALIDHVDILGTSVESVKYPVAIMTTPDDFGLWFSGELKRLSMTQGDFHQASGIARSTVSTWARGTRVPDPPSCDVISDVLRLPLDLVLAKAGHRPDHEDSPIDHPSRILIGLIDRINWTPERFDVTFAMLNRMVARTEAEGRGNSHGGRKTIPK